eukprot:TRINITY_DN80728_c0_g1_i1.p1 TRINITY_DN80728_c0_g1~~TRINITY_DN80728_c0_g1_i1.p1  ORF type:complete len:460 (-),score=94.67 TRINITY_DN80728_c0_g1_i1:92-1345(-)
MSLEDFEDVPAAAASSSPTPRRPTVEPATSPKPRYAWGTELRNASFLDEPKVAERVPKPPPFETAVEEPDEESVPDVLTGSSPATSSSRHHSRRKKPVPAAGTEIPFFQYLLSLPTQFANSQLLRKEFLCKPLPRGGGTLRCRLDLLQTGGVRNRYRYMLYYVAGESTAVHGGETEVLLLAAERQQQASLGPYYVISTNATDFNRDSKSFVARLSGNMLCTQYILHGARQSKASSIRSEFAAMRFRKPDDAPRVMQVAIPALERSADVEGQVSSASFSSRSGNEGNLTRAWTTLDGQAAADSSSVISQSWKAEGEDGYIRLASPPARWDAARKVYNRDFHGRVGVASSKNFQLAAADSHFQVISEDSSGAGLCLQFGRVAESNFAFDTAYPLSPVQAFGIALSVFDDRIAEAMRLYY